MLRRPTMSGVMQGIARTVTAFCGGYAFCWGFTALGIAGLVAIGMDFHEAETGALLMAFLVFLGMFLWSFAANSLFRVCAVLAGGGGVMAAAAWWIQHSLLNGG